ncbi:hypothetical protein PV326_008288 [Microctonus aethiopoides]|nr:hypothetical protein PV326_008288 [Microctonus aethiopoides]
MLEFADTLAERQHGVKEGFVMSQQMQSRWYIKRDDNCASCLVPSSFMVFVPYHLMVQVKVILKDALFRVKPRQRANSTVSLALSSLLVNCNQYFHNMLHHCP